MADADKTYLKDVGKTLLTASGKLCVGDDCCASVEYCGTLGPTPACGAYEGFDIYLTACSVSGTPSDWVGTGTHRGTPAQWTAEFCGDPFNHPNGWRYVHLNGECFVYVGADGGIAHWPWDDGGGCQHTSDPDYQDEIPIVGPITFFWDCECSDFYQLQDCTDLFSFITVYENEWIALHGAATIGQVFKEDGGTACWKLTAITKAPIVFTIGRKPTKDADFFAVPAFVDCDLCLGNVIHLRDCETGLVHHYIPADDWVGAHAVLPTVGEAWERWADGLCYEIIAVDDPFQNPTITANSNDEQFDSCALCADYKIKFTDCATGLIDKYVHMDEWLNYKPSAPSIGDVWLYNESGDVACFEVTSVTEPAIIGGSADAYNFEGEFADCNTCNNQMIKTVDCATGTIFHYILRSEWLYYHGALPTVGTAWLVDGTDCFEVLSITHPLQAPNHDSDYYSVEYANCTDCEDAL